MIPPTIPNFEIAGIALLDFSTPINVINIYRKAQAYTNQSEWKKLLDYTDQIEGETILSEDFNAHDTTWSLNSTPVGETLIRVLNDNNLIIFNDSDTPTIINRPHWSKGSTDITLASANLSLNSEWEVSNDTHGSDHFPISIKITNTAKVTYTNRVKLNYNKLNWDNSKLR